jgi:hypothetical protein
MEGFVGDIEEYFDFDLMPDYKSHFESLKESLDINKDFDRLRQKLEFLEQQQIVERPETTTSLILFLTVGGLLIGVMAIILNNPSPPNWIVPALKWTTTVLGAVVLTVLVVRALFVRRKWIRSLRRLLVSVHTLASRIFLRLRQSRWAKSLHWNQAC